MANSNGGIVGVDNPPAQIPDIITTFNSSGTLTTAPYTTEIEYLVVAGGGGGGSNMAGGGGAGGFLTGTGNPVLGGSPYPITVGAGGVAGVADVFAVPTTVAGSGSNSVLGTPSPIISTGGGAGAAALDQARNSSPGIPGGSGGGTGHCLSTQPNYPASAGTGVPGQGNPGGTSNAVSGFPQVTGSGAGGGGAGAAGANGVPTNIPSPNVSDGGPGGAGLSSSITGSSLFYAGGGGGGGRNTGAGGAGGSGVGGTGGSYPDEPSKYATAGVANRGGGGGGGGYPITLPTGPGYAGGAGGSGVVIVKELGAGVSASGIWSMDAVYDAVKAGNWTNA